MKPPKRAPCAACPYRKDSPAGIWHADEYAKLPPYDNQPMILQPMGLFGCHEDDETLCSGWVGCHDMDENLAIRIAVTSGHIAESDLNEVLDYESPVALWESGAAAAEHGLSGIDEPDAKAQKYIDKMIQKRGLDGTVPGKLRPRRRERTGDIQKA